MIDIKSLLITLLIGAVAGWLANLLMGKKKGLIINIIVGILGGYVGSWLCGILGIGGEGLIWTIGVPTVGACILIAILNLLF